MVIAKGIDMINEFGGDYIQWLRGFYQVAKTGSVSAGARALNLRQPTVSHQIKSLEEHYQAQLFDRSQGSMTLTPEGQEVLNHAIDVFESVKTITKRLAQKKTYLEGKITIASSHAIVVYYLAPYVTSFKKMNPLVSFELIGGMLDVIEKEVSSNDADFGIAYIDPEDTRFDLQFLFGSSLSLIASKDNQFNIKEDISIKEISKLPFIGYPPSSTINELVVQRFKQYGCDINYLLVLNHFEPVKTFTRLDFGVSIVPDHTLTDDDREHLQIVSLHRYFGDLTVGIITRKRKYLSNAAKSFLAYLKENNL